MDNPADVPTWLVALIAVVVFGGIGVAAVVLFVHHSRSLLVLCEELGLTFHGRFERQVKLPSAFLALWKGPRRTSHRIGWLLSGEIDGVDVSVVEFRRYTGGMRDNRLHGYPITVLVFRWQGGDLPRFSLRPQRFHHRLSKAMGGQDIDFEDDREFSRAFLLQGRPEGAVRALFTPQVRELMRSRPGRVVLGRAGELVYFRKTSMWRPLTFRPGPIRTLLTESRELLDLLRGS